MLKLLSVDTSTLRGSLSLIETNKKDSKIIYQHSWEKEKAHSEYLSPSIEESFHKSNWSLDDLDGFLVTHGPGSFTGLRVGLNTVKSLAYVVKKPIYTMNSLENLALSTYKQKDRQTLPILCIINAFKNMVYIASFKWEQNTLQNILAPFALPVAQLNDSIVSPHLCLGDGYLFYKDFFNLHLNKNLIRSSNYRDYPDSLNVIPKLCKEWFEEQAKTWETACPIYIRPSSAEERLQEGLLKPLIQRSTQ